MKVMSGTKINTVAILSIAAVTLLTLGICTAGISTTVFAQQNFNSFSAKLSGSNEVPPVATTALGIAILHTLHVGHQQVINCILKTSEVSQEPTSTSATKVKMDGL